MKFSNFFWKNRKAFTLIEVLIVIAISALLSTIVISFSSLSKNEVSVSVEEAKISQFLFQAKSLSMATYSSGQNVCGYGVSFDYTNQTYSIFAYIPNNVSSCPDAQTVYTEGISSDELQKYTDSTWKVRLTKGVNFQENTDSPYEILFYPPDPMTLISFDGATFTSNASSAIYLYPSGGNSYINHISVSSAGQISM